MQIKIDVNDVSRKKRIKKEAEKGARMGRDGKMERCREGESK